MEWTQRLRTFLGANRIVLPVYLAIVILAVAAAAVSSNLATFESIRTILTLSTFLAVLGLGQGLVILTGGIDMSVPWGMATAGIMLTTLSAGQDAPLIWVLPVIILLGGAIGLANGIGVALLGVSPLVMTLAMNVVVRGATLVAINGTPTGLTPPAITYLMSGRILGWLPPVFLLVGLLYVVAIVVLRRTPYGRRVYATGTNPLVTRLAGVRVPLVVISVYVISGMMAAVAGILLTGYSTLAFVNMGDPYLLPSIAAVVVGGAAITGGRGTPIGTLGGAIMLTLLGTLLTALVLPPATRNIAFGLVVLAAVLATSWEARNARV
jgi:ribose transport system permease protein